MRRESSFDDEEVSRAWVGKTVLSILGGHSNRIHFGRGAGLVGCRQIYGQSWTLREIELAIHHLDHPTGGREAVSGADSPLRVEDAARPGRYRLGTSLVLFCVASNFGWIAATTLELAHRGEHLSA